VPEKSCDGGAGGQLRVKIGAVPVSWAARAPGATGSASLDGRVQCVLGFLKKGRKVMKSRRKQRAGKIRAG